MRWSSSASRISRYLASLAARNSSRRSPPAPPPPCGGAAARSRRGPRARPAPAVRQRTPRPKAYARVSSRPNRALYSERARRRRASGEGQAATRAPSSTIAPPIQIHATSGETITKGGRRGVRAIELGERVDHHGLYFAGRVGELTVGPGERASRARRGRDGRRARSRVAGPSGRQPRWWPPPRRSARSHPWTGRRWSSSCATASG